MRDIGVTQAMYARFFIAALSLTAALATAVVYGWGGVQAIDGALTVGTVVALAAYLTRLYAPLTSLSNVQIDVMTALVSFDRVFEVLDLPPMIADSPDARPMPRVRPPIEFDHVDFRYPTAEEVSLASLESVAVLDTSVSDQVLFDVTLHRRAGPDGGVGRAVGCRQDDHQPAAPPPLRRPVRRHQDQRPRHPPRHPGVAGRHRRRGHPGRPPLPRHDPGQPALRPPEATDGELDSALAGAQIATMVESLPDGLDTVVGDRGYRLSGGEKQRLAIARLLLKAPEIVVLDEATAHLDSESEAAVQMALATALEGRTSLVIAHRLSTVREADMILVLDHGRIVEQGRHDDLLSAGGQYAELYRIQFEGQDADDPADDVDDVEEDR